MSYSNPNPVSYSYPGLAFTAAKTVQIKPAARNNRGVILDIHATVTVTFTQVTTPAYVRVGTVATPALYAELNMGAAAAGTAYNVRDGLAAGLKPIAKDIDLARDGVSFIQMVTVPMTGGAPAGTADLVLTILWS